jgi:hypothetical protein
VAKAPTQISVFERIIGTVSLSLGVYPAATGLARPERAWTRPCYG